MLKENSFCLKTLWYEQRLLFYKVYLSTPPFKCISSGTGFPHCKEWDIELKILSKFGVLLVGILWILAGVSEVFAFSIGGLQVQSKFGGKFKASFEVNLDFDGPVEVSLGDADDYRKFGLNRQGIINSLVIDPHEPSGKLRKTILIRSNNPLFFPSFNLVVKATHNGGTLLENFLVTVDFQQSLALNVEGNKKNSEKLSQKKPELLKGRENLPDSAKVQQFEKKVSEKGSPKERVVTASPESPSKTPKPKVSKQNSIVAPEISTEPAEVLSPKAIVPVPAKVHVMYRRRASGVIWAYPRSIPDLTIATPTQDDLSKTQIASTEKGYILKRGEGLFLVGSKLKIDNYHPAQIAIAIWMNNIDKFMFGNINGIREGVRLDLQNLEDTLLNIDVATARRALKSQALEWRLAKSATPVEKKALDKETPEIPLPSERMEDYLDLFKQVTGWQTTWEKMDIEGHLAYYQDLKTEHPIQARKKKFLAGHPKPHLATSSKMLVFKEGNPLVFFEQDVYSESLKSRGLKELEWTQSQSVWKIRRENFYKNFSHSGLEPSANQDGVKAQVNEGNALSFVIHVSSHANKSSTVSVTNQLRENGFDAYWVPVRVFRGLQIYRVYVGRFSDWNQAHRVIKVLSKKSFGRHATAIPYPFTLQVEEAGSLMEARMLLESLRKSGLSGLLLVSYEEPRGIIFRVVVGAFKKADNATWMRQQLKQSGFAGKLISP